MVRRLKKLGVATLLLITKSFVYIGRHSLRLRLPALKWLVNNIGRIAWRVIILTALPIYQRYRQIRNDFKRVFATGHSYILRSISHRYILHAAIFLLAILTVYSNATTRQSAAADFGKESLIAQLVSTDEEYSLVSPAVAPDVSTSSDNAPTTPSSSNETPARTFLSYSGNAVFQPYIPNTENSIAPRQRIEEYIVDEGDTLAGISAKFQLQLQTVLLTNNLTARSVIRPGQKLTILPVDGLTHTVKKGETVSTIATKYRVTSSVILSFNNLADGRRLTVGEVLIVPGGKPIPQAPARPSQSNVAVPNVPAIDSGTRLLWPAINHGINQYFTWRHNGIDIKGKTGQPIYAAESGTVLESRWGGGYGNMLLIKHDNGIVTRYGHASKLVAVAGQRVARGEIIGLIGSTGRSTGPHIHFEVIVGGKRVNPLSYTR